MNKKGQILVVDDQSGIRLLLQAFFAQNGWSVLVASNGLEGLKLVETQEFDFAFIDMKMPIMDGVTFIEELVKRNKKFPWALMTAYGEAELASKAVALGTVAIIPKPFDMDDVLQLVKSHASECV